MKSLTIWKISTLVFAGVAAYLLATSSTPVAEAAGECHGQPHMAAAKRNLHQAKADLEAAEHNKGGWRVAAIAAVNTAIAETNKGCEAAN